MSPVRLGTVRGNRVVRRSLLRSVGPFPVPPVVVTVHSGGGGGGDSGGGWW